MTGDSRDWPHRYDVLKVADLFVDDTYQRGLTGFVAKVAEKWDPLLVGVLVVSDRGEDAPADKRYAVVDGQTRRAAAELIDVPELPCVVYTGLTIAQEASLFAKLQRERKSMASWERFRASLVAPDDEGGREARAILKIAKRAGYEIEQGQTGRPKFGQQPKRLSAVAALEKVYARDNGPDLLERTLTVLKEAWKDKHVPGGDLIRGVAFYLASEPSVDDERLARRLSVENPESMKRRASAISEGNRGGGSGEKYMALAIAGIYKRRGED